MIAVELIEIAPPAMLAKTNIFCLQTIVMKNGYQLMQHLHSLPPIVGQMYVSDSGLGPVVKIFNVKICHKVAFILKMM